MVMYKEKRFANYEISIKVNDREAQKLLKSPEVEKVILKAAKLIAKDAQKFYRMRDKDFTFTAELLPPNATRAQAVAASHDGDAVRYSEAYRGGLLFSSDYRRKLGKG